MHYLRIYSDDAGESHFEDITVSLVPVEFAPPAPPIEKGPLQWVPELPPPEPFSTPGGLALP